MSINMKTLTQALAKIAAVTEKTVQTTVQEVTGSKPLQDYKLLDQIGSARPVLIWKLCSAKAARESNRLHQYPTVCVWVLDKRGLSEARAWVGLLKAVGSKQLDGLQLQCSAALLIQIKAPDDGTTTSGGIEPELIILTCY